MIFWNVFLNSIRLPNKKALFNLNRNGLDIALIYTLILLLFVSLPSLVDRLLNASGISADMNILFTLIYFFIFYYLPLAIIVFINLSIIAYIGKVITRLMNRKLHYSILWKMSAFTVTIPFLLYTVIAFVLPVNDIYLFFSFIYTIGLLIKMISIYPKRRNRSKS
ncbi:DUF1189 family protein [Oceanobacillus halophilus]|uniref:DUF1189 domain-containing protein n=1 Tax=Oceanobacillus halophilus TaxID=930130 RepID=A0A495A0W1_9BACI|nr:DUF1189 family protein [Oceanobacillus halophilus]RKQ32957.1 DUF1189 domain-containing protein [Oceanobacillus halophilus]